jgi:hypothetical protein
VVGGKLVIGGFWRKIQKLVGVDEGGLRSWGGIFIEERITPRFAVSD